MYRVVIFVLLFFNEMIIYGLRTETCSVSPIPQPQHDPLPVYPQC